MTKWVLKGLRTGVRSTQYPAALESAAGISPGRPVDTRTTDEATAARLSALCPTEAIAPEGDGVKITDGRCVHCLRCVREDAPTIVNWEDGYEWAAEAET